MNDITPIVSRTGALLFRGTETGPRGGRKTWYCGRREGQSEPSAWAIWAERMADAGDTAGTGARI